jgi:hypothetical protein
MSPLAATRPCDRKISAAARPARMIQTGHSHPLKTLKTALFLKKKNDQKVYRKSIKIVFWKPAAPRHPPSIPK